MGYYHIEVTSTVSSYYTVFLPWGKYKYLCLPMGLCNSPNIFQEKMSELMTGLEFAWVYIDDLLVLSHNNFEDHVEKLEEALSRLQEVGLKVKTGKSSFAQKQV